MFNTHLDPPEPKTDLLEVIYDWIARNEEDYALVIAPRVDPDDSVMSVVNLKTGQIVEQDALNDDPEEWYWIVMEREAEEQITIAIDDARADARMP